MIDASHYAAERLLIGGDKSCVLILILEQLREAGAQRIAGGAHGVYDKASRNAADLIGINTADLCLVFDNNPIVQALTAKHGMSAKFAVVEMFEILPAKKQVRIWLHQAYGSLACVSIEHYGWTFSSLIPELSGAT